MSDAAASGARVRRINPAGLSKPPTYAHVVEVGGPHRTIYISGQTGADESGAVSGDIVAQSTRVFENMKIALAAVGAGFDDVVKITSFIVDLDANAAQFRTVRARYFTDKAKLPASTLLGVARLADPKMLVEVEAVAIVAA